MAGEIRIPPRGFIPPVAPVQQGPGKAGKTSNVVGPSFQDVLASQVAQHNGVAFSAHAQQRIAERNIALGPEEIDRIADGINRAEAKGAKDSLMLLGDTAFVVSVTNRTVVTAVDGAHLRDNVFTNIDSAVIV